MYVLWCFMTQSAFLVSFDAVFYTSKKDIKEIWSSFFQDMAFQNGGKVILKLYLISYNMESLKITLLKKGVPYDLLVWGRRNLWKFWRIPNWFQWSIWFHSGNLQGPQLHTLHYLMNEQDGISEQGGTFLDYEKQIR